MNCKMVDFGLDIDTANYRRLKGLISKYKAAKKVEIAIKINKADILDAISIGGGETRYDGSCSATALLKKMSETFPRHNAFLLHSATFDVGGVGVALVALSGTGKTTQMLNWQKLLGDKMTIVNGDKPFIRFFDKDFCEEKGLNIPEGTEFGVPYAYGTPWNGKERFGCNMRTKLKHICFIERSETNYVTKIEKHEAIDRIMQQVYIPKDPIALEKTLGLVNRLINSCELWIIHCNMEPESAKIAYETIFADE